LEKFDLPDCYAAISARGKTLRQIDPIGPLG
jgi:hypothetical protein